MRPHHLMHQALLALAVRAGVGACAPRGAQEGHCGSASATNPPLLGFLPGLGQTIVRRRARYDVLRSGGRDTPSEMAGLHGRHLESSSLIGAIHNLGYGCLATQNSGRLLSRKKDGSGELDQPKRSPSKPPDVMPATSTKASCCRRCENGEYRATPRSASTIDTQIMSIAPKGAFPLIALSPPPRLPGRQVVLRVWSSGSAARVRIADRLGLCQQRPSLMTTGAAPPDVSRAGASTAKR